MNQMTKYKLQIFETNRLDGCMSQAKKFYPSNYTEQEIKDKLQEVKEKMEKNIILMAITFYNHNKKK